MSDSRTLSAGEIMERLMRLSQRASVRLDLDLESARYQRWFVDMPNVQHWCEQESFSGRSPVEALNRTWRAVVNDGHLFLLHIFTPSDRPLAKSEQVWVKWSSAADDWEDTEPIPGRDDQNVLPYPEFRRRQSQNQA